MNNNRYIRNALVWPLAIAVTTAWFPAQAERPMHFDHIGLEDGLSQSSVMDIHEDSRGFLWFATENGLNRYDGYAIHTYFRNRRDPDSLQGDYIWAMAEDETGDLWLATEGAGVVRWDRQTDSFESHLSDPEDPASLASNIARTLLLDDGFVWVGTRESGLDRLDPRTGSVTHFRHRAGDPGSLSSDIVYALLVDTAGDLWVGTENGLNRFDRATGRFTRFIHRPDDPTSLSSSSVISLYEDSDGTLWIGTFDGGLNRFERDGESFTSFRHDPANDTSLSHDHVRVIYEDSQARLWVGTEDGLNLMDRETGSFASYRHSSSSAQSLGDSYVMSIDEDSSGVLWVGTRAAGLSKWNTRGWSLGHHRDEWLTDADVTSFAEDGRGRTWVGSFGNGVALLDGEMALVDHLRPSADSTPRLSDGNVMSLLMDGSGSLWIGTMSGGLNRYDPADGAFEVFRHDPNDAGTLSADGVMSLHEDPAGNIWIGTFGGGVTVYERRDDRFVRLAHDPGDPTSLSNSRATAIVHDHGGNIWVGTQGGGLNLYDPKTRSFHRFSNEPDNPDSLSSNTIYALHVDAAGVLWIGTAGGGLDRLVGSPDDPGQIRFANVSTIDGLPSNVIYGIHSDDGGNLWLSSNNGLVRYNAEAGTFKTIQRHHGLQGNEFNFGAHHRGATGRLYFGGANGFNAFDPSNLPESTHAPRVVLTAFEKFNEPVAVAQPYELLDEISLDYRDDVVTFEFAALDFVAPEQNRYLYRLRGFDRDWVDLGNRRRVTYTNLDSQDYVLEVRAANSDGVWNESGLSIPVSVARAPWETRWAYAAYVAAALLLGFLLWRHHRTRLESQARHSQRLEAEVRDRTAELEQRNRELLEANLAKSQFLARMSHEIRTPMNGVLGMTELLSKTGLNDRQQRFANTIQSSASSLLEIINDILDFSKIEAGKLELEDVEFDAIDLVEDAAELLAGPAAEKGLELICATPPDHVPRVMGDPLRIRQILINLIGNAIKFTERGEVIARFATVEESKDSVELRFEVKDSGIGISAAHQALIFDCFSQEDGSTTRRYGGTGLGLAISKQLVELMNGEIGVESAPGAGSTFWFTLRLKKARGLAPIRWCAQSLQSMRVLIVDGNDTHRKLLKGQLTAWQVDADCATSHAVALRALRDAAVRGAAYTVALIDIGTADVRGQTLIREIRMDGRLRDLKLIVMTPVGDQDKSELDALKVDFCLNKPVRQSALYDSLVELNSEAKRSAQAAPETDIDAFSDGARILLVEDNPVNREVALGMLKLLGCRVEVAHHGKAALDRATQQRFDLILMDCQMPVMDGFEATMAIRNFEARHDRQRTPIVAVTAGALEGDREKCLASGMDDHLTKPYTLQALYVALKRWLPLERGDGEERQADPPEIRAEELLDRSALESIRKLERSGNPRMVSRVIELYLNNSAELMSELTKAFNADDATRVARTAHTLKSSSANLGAMAFAELCRVLESESKAGDLVESSGLYRQVSNLYPKVVAALKLELSRKSA